MALEPPIIKIYEFDTTELASPAPMRPVIAGSFAFESVVGSGCGPFNILSPNTTSGALNFKGTKFNLIDNPLAQSHLASTPSALVIVLQSSGVAISNIKIHLTEDQALNRPALDRGLDPAFVQYTVSGIWQPNCVLPSGAGTKMSKSIPLLANVMRQDGHFGLLGEDDRNVSQFIYINIVIPWGFPFDTFGICGSGFLRFGISYDYWFNDYMLEFGVP